MKEKKRLDVYLTEQNLAPSREKARALIMAGVVYLNNQKADKAGETVADGDTVEVRGEHIPFVSRGGLKLDKAVKAFGLDLQGAVCVDVGASTGGFTDCMLQNGASKVYCIDVGYGQLAWSIRNDPRVVNMERTNIRNVTREMIPDELDFASVDVSFISLSHILPVLAVLLREGGQAMCLIKPQFEAGREHVGKNGVVREVGVHVDTVLKVYRMANTLGFSAQKLDFSPIKGPKGNIEYLILLEKSAKENAFTEDDAKELVLRSHEMLSGGNA